MNGKALAHSEMKPTCCWTDRQDFPALAYLEASLLSKAPMCPSLTKLLSSSHLHLQRRWHIWQSTHLADREVGFNRHALNFVHGDIFYVDGRSCPVNGVAGPAFPMLYSPRVYPSPSFPVSRSWWRFWSIRHRHLANDKRFVNDGYSFSGLWSQPQLVRYSHLASKIPCR